MTEIKLKPCPTCKKVPQVITFPSTFSLNYCAIIRCCENYVYELYETREQALYAAINTWNRRNNNA